MHFMTYTRVHELRQHLEGTRAQVISFGSDDYAEDIKRWSDTCEKDAGAIVRVTSTFEVSEVIRFAQKYHVAYVVKAGGHSTTGSSASRGGIVISLSNMRKAITDPASKTVCVQGGATWDDVNASTAPYKLVVVGATASRTGVGGTTLGGGYGWLSGRYGLIIDNLLSVKMVQADGSIISASDDENPDLFWAVRGAGQAFGVVTEFVFQAHNLMESVFGGLLYFTADKLSKIVVFANFFNDLMDENSGFFFGFTGPSFMDQTSVYALLFYNGPRPKAEAFFAPLLSLGPAKSQIGMMPYAELNSMANIDPTPEGRKSFSGTNITLPLDIGFVQETYNQFDRAMNCYHRVGESILTFELLPYSQITKVPIDATACANRGHFYNVGSVFCWHDPELDSKMRSQQQAIINKIKRPTGDDKRVEMYSNYAGHDVNARHLFGDNLPRLQALKKKYDPNNVFRNWHDLFHQTESPPPEESFHSR